MGAVPDPGAHSLTGWPVTRLAGSAEELHARPLAGGRLVEVLEVTASALVLGSGQPSSDVVPGSEVEIVRRRTGGGAVLLVPGECTWIDVTIPRGDALDDDDVARAFHWLGHAWAAALQSLGLVASVHTGAPLATPWSSKVCFAGVGAGEVLVGSRKVVGMSQRRTRDAVRFQSLVLHRWDPEALVSLLGLDADAVAYLQDSVATVDVASDRLVDALTDALP